MSFFMYGLMVLCFIVMIWANGKSKKAGAAWGRPVAGLFGVMAVFFALVKIGADLAGCGANLATKKMVNREMAYTQAQMAILGEHIGAKHSGAQILLITNHQTEHSEPRMKMMRDALEEGLGSSAQIVATESPKLPADAGGDYEEMMMYGEYSVTAEVFDQMLDEHPECTMVISLIGLPGDFQEMAFWTKEEGERQKLVVVNSTNPYELRKAIMADFIQAVVTQRPDIKYDMDEVVPEGTQAAFDKRYVLITPENVNQIAGKYPRMFKPLDPADQPAPDEYEEAP